MTRIVDKSKTLTRYGMSLWNACGFWPDDFPFGPNKQIVFVLADDYDAAIRGWELSNATKNARIAELEAERKNWIEQALQGVMVEHDCPAMYACASIIADAKP